MIHYQHGGCAFFSNILQMRGSVFPGALGIALPNAAVSFTLKLLIKENYLSWPGDSKLLEDSVVWNGFSVLVGFLIVFRTSQAYNRFWDGCIWTHQMRAEWFDACASVVAFCKHSRAEETLINNFKELLVRLFSMLHACALAEIEDCGSKVEVEDVQAYHMELLDPEGIDDQSMRTLRYADCKVEVIFQWIQQVVTENISTGVLSVPPPILSRSYQEIANGMLAFHQAIKIANIPFPFPYAQMCDTLLLMHWVVVPIVCVHWTTEPYWAALFSFMQVIILWSLNFIAVEIENPFGLDDNDLDARYMQDEMNRHLAVLLRPEVVRSPSIKTRVSMAPKDGNSVKTSLMQCWGALLDELGSLPSADAPSGQSMQHKPSHTPQNTVRLSYIPSARKVDRHDRARRKQRISTLGSNFTCEIGSTVGTGGGTLYGSSSSANAGVFGSFTSEHIRCVTSTPSISESRLISTSHSEESRTVAEVEAIASTGSVGSARKLGSTSSTRKPGHSKIRTPRLSPPSVLATGGGTLSDGVPDPVQNNFVPFARIS